jgi:hypothetical protein
VGWKRDKVVGLLPWALVEDIDAESRDPFNHNGFGNPPGIVSLIADCYREPKNPTELGAHRELVEKGYVPLKRGWPDFFVFGKDGDLFLVEVKSDTDVLRPSQRVILELFAERGIDCYVRWGSEEPFHYQRIGKSKKWHERFVS